MKRYVTGCKHFRDPVLDTEYKSFASQNDDYQCLGDNWECSCLHSSSKIIDKMLTFTELHDILNINYNDK